MAELSPSSSTPSSAENTERAMTYDLERLLRWEEAGATWEAIWPRAGEVTIVLCTCDSGEEVDRYTSAAADLLDYARSQGPAEQR